MKKRWIWLAVMAVAVAGIGYVLSCPAAPVEVKTVTLTPRRVEQTVSCTGVVEAEEHTGEGLPIPCILKEVCVGERQQVERGQCLAVVDKEATRQLLTGQAEALMTLAAMNEEITAPATGIVMTLQAAAGEKLEAGVPCAVLAARDTLRVRVAIRERDLPALKAGLEARVSGDGFSKNSYGGTLEEIASTAGNSGTGVVVEGVVALSAGEADASLRLGLTARAEIVTAVFEAALVVPYEAVLSDAQGESIYVVENGVAHRRVLAVRDRLAEGVLLDGNTLEGATVVLEPQMIEEDGAAVHGIAGEVL